MPNHYDIAIAISTGQGVKQSRTVDSPEEIVNAVNYYSSRVGKEIVSLCHVVRQHLREGASYVGSRRNLKRDIHI